MHCGRRALHLRHLSDPGCPYPATQKPSPCTFPARSARYRGVRYTVETNSKHIIDPCSYRNAVNNRYKQPARVLVSQTCTLCWNRHLSVLAAPFGTPSSQPIEVVKCLTYRICCVGVDIRPFQQHLHNSFMLFLS